MKTTPKIPEIPEDELTPLVTALMEIIRIQQEQIQELRDEIARLKGQKPKPKIKPSVLEKYFENMEPKKEVAKRPGSTKREKTDKLEIHETVIVKADNVPPRSMFKGYEEFTVQGLIFQPHNTLYRRERWQTPEGASIVAPLPEEIKRLGSHFDSSLQSFILYQYYFLSAPKCVSAGLFSRVRLGKFPTRSLCLGVSGVCAGFVLCFFHICLQWLMILGKACANRPLPVLE
jgi:hypothetical protein